jgi:hypothetical protein
LRAWAFAKYTGVLGREPSEESERRLAIVQEIDDAIGRNDGRASPDPATWAEAEAIKKKLEGFDRDDDDRADADARESRAAWIAYEQRRPADEQARQAADQARDKLRDDTYRAMIRFAEKSSSSKTSEEPEPAGAALSKGGQPKDEKTELGLKLVAKWGIAKKAEILKAVCALDAEYDRMDGAAQAEFDNRTWKNILQARRRNGK